MRTMVQTGEVLALPRVPGGDWRITRRALDAYLEEQERIALVKRDENLGGWNVARW